MADDQLTFNLRDKRVRKDKQAGKRGYHHTKRSADGMFQPDIKQDVNEMLDIYCRINNINKTHLVNDILREWLAEKFEVLRETRNPSGESVL